AQLAEPFSETESFGARPASVAAGCFSHGHALGALFSQAHTSLKRKFAGLTIPRLSVFIAKVGQPCGTQNHLTELLDERARRSYSERTLQPGRTPGRGSQGVCRTLPAEERKAGGPQIRLLFPADGGARVGRLVESPLPGLARLRPDVLERGEVQVALRGEVPVEDRLRDSGRAGNLRCRRAVVAALGEEADRGLDQVLPAVGRRHP